MIDTKIFRQKLLDLAIRGKLVSQDPNDEHATVLLERIREEKKKLVEEGKLKADKTDSTIFRGSDNLYYETIGDKTRCIQDEIPFEIPENWVWVRLGETGQTNIGLTYKPSDLSNEGIPVLRSNNIVDARLNLNELVRVGIPLDSKVLLHKNDLLICARNGSKSLIGKCAIIDNISEPMAFGAFMTVVRSNINFWLYLIICSYYFRNYMNKAFSTQICQLTQSMLKRTLVPLPPLSEQKRIVEKLEKIIAQVDAIDSESKKLEVLATRTKGKLLDLAIRGKLVPQDPNDEPASVLLERIKEEKEKLIKEGKIKREKPLPEIDDDEKPFEIPGNWIWIRLGDCSLVYNGNSINAEEKQRKYSIKCEGFPFIATKDIGFDSVINYENGIYIPKGIDSFKIAPQDSVLLCMEGGSAGKKIGYLTQDVCFGNKLCCFASFVLNAHFLFYYLQSSCFVNNFKENICGLIGGVGTAKLRNMLLPLPPLEEQKRIVSKLEELLPLCDRLTGVRS